MSLVLHHWEPNGFSLKALLALYEKGLTFESRYEDWLALGQARTESAEAISNLEIESPLLIHDGKAISDSLFMIQYLDDTFPTPPLMQEGAHALWDLLAWGRLAGEVLAPSVSTLGCRAYLAPLLARRDRDEVRAAIARLPTLERRAAWSAALDNSYGEDEIANARRRLRMVVDKIEACLAGQPWLLGECFSLCDIELFASAVSAPLFDVAQAREAPRFHDWLARIKQRPSYAQAVKHSRAGAPETAFAPGPEHSRWG